MDQPDAAEHRAALGRDAAAVFKAGRSHPSLGRIGGPRWSAQRSALDEMCTCICGAMPPRVDRPALPRLRDRPRLTATGEAQAGDESMTKPAHELILRW